MSTTLKTAEKIFSEVPSIISREEGLAILDGSVPLTACLDQAFQERNRYFENKVRIHILDNIKNGYCPEDCGYCAQRKNANSGVQEYPMKSETEIYEDAVKAKENGAYRFCMVTSGTGPNKPTTEKLASTIRRITDELGMKVCLSAGLLDEEKAQLLKAAGLDRYNHNLNTSENHYPEICDTHTYSQRAETLGSVSKAGIGMCSGVIVGMGETLKDIVEVAFELKSFRVISIPVNFFIPVKGHAIKNPSVLTPELCVRILCLFRLVNPDSEIRIAAGREGHLRSLAATALFAANSLFSSGYLNVKGSDMLETVGMIRDAGFVPELADGGILPEDSETTSLYSEKNFPELYKFRKEISAPKA